MITCPSCYESGDPALIIRDVAICSNCGATLKVSEDQPIRLSRLSDIEGFDVAEMAQLRRARGAIARPGRRQR